MAATPAVSDAIVTKELLDHLGLKRVRALDFHFQKGGLATVTACMYLEREAGKELESILMKYKLVPIEDEDASFATGGILQPDPEKYTKLVHG